MNKFSYYLFITILLINTNLLGQGIVNNDYVKLKSQGDFPETWRFSLAKGSPNNFEKEYTSTKISKDFLMKNDLVLKRIYNSGYLYYGDSITMYINEVANNLLQQANPDLVGRFTFYTAGSQYVNASSMSQGVIFINVGLIAQLSNEAELAFVIAHEISHNILHHSAIRYEERNDESGNSYENEDEIIFKNNYNSREDETEADANAINELLAKTNYNLYAAVSIFDVLQYSYLPLDNIPLSTNYFDLATFKVSSRSFLGRDSLQKIATDENYDEKKSTHPKCATRREIAMDLISNFKNGADKVYYSLGEDRFKRIRDYARFETIYEQITAKEITSALYNVYVLEQTYPGNKFLETAKAYCLYVAQIYRNKKNTSKIIPSYKKIEGESGQVNYFLRNVDIKELNVLTVRNLYDLVKKYPDDNFLMTVYLDALKSMVVKQDIKLSVLKRVSKEDEVIDTTTNTATSSKYSNIKKNTVSEDYKYAFWDIIKDPLFYDKILEFEKAHKISKQEDDIEIKQEYSKDDFNKIVIINPEYHRTNVKDPIKGMLRDEMGTNKMRMSMANAAKNLNIKVNILDNGLKQFTTESYNDKTLIVNSLIEILNEDFSAGEVKFNSKYTESIVQNQGSRFYGWNGVSTGREKGPTAGETIMIIYVFPIPWILPGLIMPDYSTTSVLIVVDLKTGKKFGTFETKIGNGENAINQAMYTTFYKFKKLDSEEGMDPIEVTEKAKDEENEE